MKELLEVIETTTQIKSISYDIDSGVWLVTSRGNYPKSFKVDSDDLIEFLKNSSNSQP